MRVMLRDHLTDAGIGSAGSKILGAGAALTGYGYFTATEIAAILGTVIAFIGMLIAWVYKRRDYALKLQQAAALARIAALDEQIRQQRLDRMHRASQRHAAVTAEQRMLAERDRLAAAVDLPELGPEH